MEYERVRRNVYLDKDLVDKAEKDAKRLGLSFSAYVNVAISEYLKSNSVPDLVQFLQQMQQGQVKGE